MRKKKLTRTPRWFLPAALLISLLLAMVPACLGTDTALAETPPSIQWSKTFGSIFDEGGYSIQRTSGGGYVVVGYYADSISNYDAWLIKTDESGNKQWEMMFGDVYDDYAYSVQQTADGGYVMVGQTYSYGNGGSDIWLIKTDATGTKQWDRTFGGSSYDEGRSVQQTADGGYVVAGLTYSHGAGGSDLWLIKTDASGVMEWGKTFGGSSGDVGYSVQQIADGGYVVAGGTHSPGAGYFDAWLIKIDASGNWQWGKTFGGAADDYAYSLQQTTDGGFVMAGWTASDGAGYDDFYLVKTDASGNWQWERTFGGSDDDWAYSVQQTADGGYVLTGITESYGAGGVDLWLVKTDSSGNRQWDKAFGGSDDDEGYSSLQAAGGGYVVAGRTTSYGAGARDVWLIKTTDCTPPPAPALVSPANEAKTNDSTPHLDWSEVTDPSGIDFYWVQVDTESHFPTPFVDLAVPSSEPSEYTVPSALADGPYYWRVYARDNASNYSPPSAVWSFTVDSEAPPVPTLISPADGAVANDSTPILGWSGVTDPSGIDYWVQVDNDSDFSSPFINLTVTPPEYEVSLALADGLHYWRVYARDGAGNYSLPSAVWSFTVDTSAPPEVATGAATGLGSTVATLNGHLTSLGSASSVDVSFEWGLTDAYGNATTPLPVTDPGDFDSPLEGLTPETVYHFRAVASGDATVYGNDMTFTTDVATTTPPEVATIPATGIGTTAATLNGNLSALGTASPVEVFFEWGLTVAYGNATTPLAVTGTGAFDSALSGLTAATTYHFRAVAMGDGTVYGDDMPFTTDTSTTTPPAVTTVAATGIGSTVATLNGSLTVMGTASPVEVFFEWGLTVGYGNATTPLSVADLGQFNFPLEGLTPATTYHFRARARGDGTVNGDDLTFTTDVATTTPPEVGTTAATGVGSTVATLNGILDSLGTASPVEVSFEWGLTPSYGNTTTALPVTASGAFNFSLSGLTPAITYHFRAIADGDGTVYGDDMPFTTDAATADTTPPATSSVDASEITASGATITWTTDEPATSRVEYGLTDEYGSFTALDNDLVNSHSVELTGLKAGQIYHYRIISTDASGNETVSPDFTLETPGSPGGTPAWVWVLIGLAAAAVVGAAAFFIRGRLAKT